MDFILSTVFCLLNALFWGKFMNSLVFDISPARILTTKYLGPKFPDIYYSKLSPVRLRAYPDRPLPGPRFVRVRPTMAGICGSDIALFFIKAGLTISMAALPPFPKVFMGHEMVGTVVETGTGVSGLKRGDRVAMQKYTSCCATLEIDPPCGPCSKGNFPLCQAFPSKQGPQDSGAAFSDIFVAHENQLVKVPDSLTDDQAVLVEPAAVALHTVFRRLPRPGEKALVIGAGTIGLNVVQIAKAVCSEAQIFVIEPFPLKLELAKRLGAEALPAGNRYDAVGSVTGAQVFHGRLKNSTLLGGFDVIYDSVGASATMHDSLRWLAPRGDYVMVGTQLSPVSFDITPLWNQELSMIGVNAHGMENVGGRTVSSFELAMEMVSDSRVNFDGFITHRFPFGNYLDAFRTIQENPASVVKVILEMK
jgi:2-desacetyl-2-hydroxyethyl bacteriochlorophyllide A dehydrogenase